MNQRSGVIVGFCNLKGGVGKTSSCLQTGHAAARLGLKVLFVDLDPQANLSSHLLPDEDIPLSLADVVAGEKSSLEVIYSSTASSAERANWIDIVPSGGLALQVSAEIAQVRGVGEQRIKKALSSYSDYYDIVLCDTGPNLSLLTRGVLLIANHIILVTQPEFDSMDGLKKVIATVEELEKDYEENINVAGIFVNDISYSRKDHLANLSTLRNKYSILLEIPTKAKISRINNSGLGLDESTEADTSTNVIAQQFDNCIEQLIKLDRV